jgi:ATP-dependent helicase Lhr and Lhr-like helicase
VASAGTSDDHFAQGAITTRTPLLVTRPSEVDGENPTSCAAKFAPFRLGIGDFPRPRAEPTPFAIVSSVLPPFHPTVAAWFRERFGEPSPPQAQGWPRIAAGEHVLIAAPTGTGKTLAAFLHALDALLQKGPSLPPTTQVVYVSPLRALANDVQKNLQQPLAELRARDPSLPEIRVLVRSGDTSARERAAMGKQPPHILVTTPESLYILLTSGRGRAMLAHARTLIVDEIHALAPSKRGSHFALTCERLDRLVSQHGGQLQRIGLSATQRPIANTAALLVGTRHSCAIVDIGHRRTMDLAVEVPGAPLDTICSGEHWQEIFARIEALIREHRTTLVFTNTRKMAERVAARLAERLGKDQVTSHHGSLAKARRLDAEQRLKRGELRALVATGSLELGIDIGDVDLVVQVGPTPSIAAFLQRVGRAGHTLAKVPKGRLFPLTRDELAASAALLLAVRLGRLDVTELPRHPLDVLAQQIVAIGCDEALGEDDLFALVTATAPYAELPRERFDAVLAMHAQGRQALLHRDPVHRVVRSTRRARLAAVTCGGAIPEVADWKVVLDHDETAVGTVHEDFAIESSVGDVFQLGATSWQIRRIGSGTLRVADAHGVPPSLPFWIAEGPARSAELSATLTLIRQHGTDANWLAAEVGLGGASAAQLAEYLQQARDALGALPTTDHLVLERFFDETGGQQLVLHTPFGSRINRALGLALRKRFCTSGGFELQAAANDEAILISLGPMHSFPLEDVWTYLHPNTARDVLVQALLPAPMFQARWRWNSSRALLVERFRGGRKVPAPLLRFRSDDALALAFPAAQACPETLPPGPIEVPEEHPLVAQTIADCLHEAMDIDGFLALLARIHAGGIGLAVAERSEPSPLAQGILHAMPYAFLDDAPLEERRSQAVAQVQRGARSDRTSDPDFELDAAALQLVAEQAWPEPRSATELHEALGWMGWLGDDELAPAWRPWLAELAADGRAQLVNARWFAAGAARDDIGRWRGRLEAVLPIWHDALDDDDRAALQTLAAEGVAMQARCGGRLLWAHRRLLARVRNAMIERLRAAVQPVSPADFERFLPGFQQRTEATARSGPRGLLEALTQLATASHTVDDWENELLPQHLVHWHREWLDQCTLGGEFVWLRLWGPWRGPLGRCEISLVPRAELPLWLELPNERADTAALTGPARVLFDLLQQRGALFPTDLQAHSRLLPSHLETGLAELVGLGLASCDSFAAMRQLAVPPSRRAFPVHAIGRWSLLPVPPAATRASDAAIELATRSLLRRFGVLWHGLLLQQRVPLPWRLLLRTLRAMELAGEVRGGRFVSGQAGEQYALPTAITALRAARTAAAAAG